MTFADLGGHAPFVVDHLEGWTLVRVRRDVGTGALAPVLDLLRADPSRQVALDLKGHDLLEAAPAVAELVREKAAGGAVVVVVASDQPLREALRDAGVAEVHESLDQALAVDAPAIVFQHDRVAAPLPPSQADVTVVTATDLLGPGAR